MTNKYIEGRVANIINERELAINIGSNNGVRTGMKFKVLADHPTEIRDPETNEVLGIVDREKVRVQATEVYEKFSVCKTYRIVSTTRRGILFDFPDLVGQTVRTRETLRAEKSSYLPPLPEEESFVKRGDRVVQIDNDD